MKILLFIFSISLISYSQAQIVDLQVIGSLGGSYADANLDVNYTAGEAVIETLSSGSTVLTQGFHQPDYGVGAIDELVVNNDISLYPNPALNELNISFTENTVKYGTVSVLVYDTQGKLMYSGSHDVNPGTNGIIQLDLNSLQTGHYLLHIENSEGMVSRAKFIKL